MLRDIRKQYAIANLNEDEAEKSALSQFKKWLDDALQSAELEPTAMIISTVDASMQPHARVVLLKEFDSRGLVFYSNYNSHKGKQIETNPKVSALFLWQSLERQVRITGSIEKISEDESIAYFKSRPLDSQLGAYASPQSEVIANKAFLEKRFETIKLQFGSNIQKPEHWGGYLIRPQSIEFWQGRPNRLHDRLFYSRLADDTWKIERLAP
ncbi:MAG: pyridoxamine 5'-phosphate oxidase [Porphyromonadaceae bacterium CG2_30_38_12]|nr:MAG: pyridoxamine 5'-phosphate oxidase [Porphyromonadaceae bacterium CG2_30_38_12]